MGRINVLDKSVAELIAAGEVIERPSSIVKELLENSIDAQASAITVEIQEGGIRFLRITDNGSGIERDDVPLAFMRHATSKVRDESDLDSIMTLGFRGEALASVSAVSKVELLTKTREETLGTKIVIHGGETVEQGEAGCPDGTTVLVRDLFYNIPARLKFLKKSATEGSAVQSVVEKIALSHPEVSFRFIKDNKTVLHTAGDGKLISAIYAVLGKEFANSLIEVDYTHEEIHVTGFVTKPSAGRNNRSMQHFFVNHRYVKSTTCMVSLEEGFKNSLMTAKFPGCVLNLSIDSAQIDVNVHPAKIEIRFVHEKPVFEAVFFAIKTALSKADILKTDVNENKTFSSRRMMAPPEQETVQMNFQATDVSAPKGTLATKPYKKEEVKFVQLSAEEYRNQFTQVPKTMTLNSPILDEKPTQKPLEQLIKTIQHTKEQEDTVDSNETLPVVAETKQTDAFEFLDATSFEKKEKTEQAETIQPLSPLPAEQENEEHEPVHIQMIGELFKTYILFEANDLFVMVDKHAAHERILFETLKQQVHLKESQVLLVPLGLTLSAEEYDILQSNKQTFEEFGFRLIFSEQHSIQIAEAPLVLHAYDLVQIIQDLIQNISSLKMEILPSRFEELLHSMACRAAIKANADNSVEELTELVEQVYLDEKIRHCPHGRPVGVTMTKYEVERRFGRHN